MANKKNEITVDSPEFKKLDDATTALGEIIMDFLADQQVEVPHGFVILGAATLNVIGALSDVTGVNHQALLDTYINGLKIGFKENSKQ